MRGEVVRVEERGNRHKRSTHLLNDDCYTFLIQFNCLCEYEEGQNSGQNNLRIITVGNTHAAHRAPRGLQKRS